MQNNPIYIAKYINSADSLLKQSGFSCSVKRTIDLSTITDEDISQYLYSHAQYAITCAGKEKKTERLRAVFGMSRTFIVIFFLAIMHTIIASAQLCQAENLLSLSPFAWNASKEFLLVIFTVCFCVSIHRTKKCARYMAVIALGTYEALTSAPKK